MFRRLEAEQREAQAVETTRRGLAQAVVNEQPATLGCQRRRRKADLVGVPPGTAASLKDYFVAAPVTQIRRIGNPNVRSHVSDGPMNHRPIIADSVRQEGGSLVFGRQLGR